MLLKPTESNSQCIPYQMRFNNLSFICIERFATLDIGRNTTRCGHKTTRMPETQNKYNPKIHSVKGMSSWIRELASHELTADERKAEKEKEISYYDGWKEGRTNGQANAYSECQ